MLVELGYPENQPIPLHVDNTSVIQIDVNPVSYERTKHIEVYSHSIREAFTSGVITLPHISSTIQAVDVFTKVLSRPWHQFIIEKLMLIDSPASI